MKFVLTRHLPFFLPPIRSHIRVRENPTFSLTCEMQNGKQGSAKQVVVLRGHGTFPKQRASSQPEPPLAMHLV